MEICPSDKPTSVGLDPLLHSVLCWVPPNFSPDSDYDKKCSLLFKAVWQALCCRLLHRFSLENKILKWPSHGWQKHGQLTGLKNKSDSKTFSSSFLLEDTVCVKSPLWSGSQRARGRRQHPSAVRELVAMSLPARQTQGPVPAGRKWIGCTRSPLKVHPRGPQSPREPSTHFSHSQEHTARGSLPGVIPESIKESRGGILSYQKGKVVSWKQPSSFYAVLSVYWMHIKHV